MAASCSTGGVDQTTDSADTADTAASEATTSTTSNPVSTTEASSPPTGGKSLADALPMEQARVELAGPGVCYFVVGRGRRWLPACSRYRSNRWNRHCVLRRVLFPGDIEPTIEAIRLESLGGFEGFFFAASPVQEIPPVLRTEIGPNDFLDDAMPLAGATLELTSDFGDWRLIFEQAVDGGLATDDDTTGRCIVVRATIELLAGADRVEAPLVKALVGGRLISRGGSACTESPALDQTIASYSEVADALEVGFSPARVDMAFFVPDDLPGEFEAICVGVASYSNQRFSTVDSLGG